MSVCWLQQPTTVITADAAFESDNVLSSYDPYGKNVYKGFKVTAEAVQDDVGQLRLFANAWIML